MQLVRVHDPHHRNVRMLISRILLIRTVVLLSVLIVVLKVICHLHVNSTIAVAPVVIAVTSDSHPNVRFKRVAVSGGVTCVVKQAIFRMTVHLT